MKRPIFVLALSLILVVAFSGQTFSRSTPVGYVNPHQDSDDHTWGGENNVAPDGSELTSTGIIAIDLIIYYLFFDKSELQTKSSDRVVLIGFYRTENDDVQTEHNEVIIYNQGN